MEKVISKLWNPWVAGIILCILAGVATDINMIGTAWALGSTGGLILFGMAIHWATNNL